MKLVVINYNRQKQLNFNSWLTISEHKMDLSLEIIEREFIKFTVAVRGHFCLPVCTVLRYNKFSGFSQV